MPVFSFLLHDEVGSSPALVTETLASSDHAKSFGRGLLLQRPEVIAVEVRSGDTRITTIKDVGGGQTSATPSHERLGVTTYRLTLVHSLNEAEPPRVIYLAGATRGAAEDQAKRLTCEAETIVDLVPLD